MPNTPSDGDDLVVAYKVGNLVAQTLSEVPASTAARVAILAARELAPLSEETAMTAISVVEQLKFVERRDVGHMARKAIITARELNSLPADLTRRVRFLSGEMAFPTEDAALVVDWLAETSRAVVELELWRPDEDGWRVHLLGLASPHDECSDSDWKSYVSCCAESARAWMQTWADQAHDLYHVPAAELLVNLFWMTQEDAHRRRDHSS